jgi:hypothetical protein
MPYGPVTPLKLKKERERENPEKKISLPTFT